MRQFSHRVRNEYSVVLLRIKCRATTDSLDGVMNLIQGEAIEINALKFIVVL